MIDDDRGMPTLDPSSVGGPPSDRSGVQKEPGAPRVPGGGGADGSPSPPESHRFNLQAHGHLVPEGDGADVLQGFASAAHSAGATQGEVDAVLRVYGAVERGGATWDAYAAALNHDPAKIGRIFAWYADGAVEDGSPLSPAERAAAKEYLESEAIPDSVFAAIEALPRDRKLVAKVGRLLADAAGFYDGEARAGDLEQAAAREFRDFAPEGSRGDPEVEGELARLRKDMGAPKGSPAWRRYWKEGGERRYRDLLGRR